MLSTDPSIQPVVNILISTVKVKVAQLSLTLSDPLDCSLSGSSVHRILHTRVGIRSLFQGIFPTQGSNPGLPHCRWILYHLSHQGSSRILEWVAYPFSRRSSDPGIEPGSPAFQVDSKPTELSGKPCSTTGCIQLLKQHFG